MELPRPLFSPRYHLPHTRKHPRRRRLLTWIQHYRPRIVRSYWLRNHCYSSCSTARIQADLMGSVHYHDHCLRSSPPRTQTTPLILVLAVTAALISAFLIGIACPLIRRGMLESTGPITLRSLRHPIRLGKQIARNRWLLLGILLAILSTLPYGYAVAHTRVEILAPVTALQYPFATLIARRLLNERLSYRQILGLCLVTIGAALLVPRLA